MTGKRVALLTGGYLSQNMGSAAMSMVTAAHLKRLGYRVALLSKYPEDDRELAERYAIEIIPANQFLYTLAVIPLLALMNLVPVLLPFVRRRFFRDAALFYDLGGITFTRDRGLAGLVINTTWLLLPLLLRVPVIKGAQAIGPLPGGLLRAPVVGMLRRAHRIHARGAETLAHLAEAGIHAVNTPDIAFLLEPEPIPLPATLEQRQFVAVLPSSVVKRRYDALRGADAYVTLMADVVRGLTARGFQVAILAHSYRRAVTDNSNDIPTCRQILTHCADDAVHYVDPLGLTPGNLKYIISRSHLAVSGRFHAMIACLSAGVPVIVTAWSHKYREVLEPFGMQDCAVPVADLTADALLTTVDHMHRRRDTLAQSITDKLPAIRTAAMGNFTLEPSEHAAPTL